MKTLRFLALLMMAVPCFSGDLDGNWVVREPRPDGTSRNIYLNLKQEGSQITGSIRVTQFYYNIKESTGGADGVTLTGSMIDGHNERQVKYEGKLVGDELHVGTRRRPEDKVTEMMMTRGKPTATRKEVL
jgi:alpha-galactosidase